MSAPEKDAITAWQPVNADAAKIVRPAFEEEKTETRTSAPLATGAKCRTAKLLAGKEPLIRTGDRIGRVLVEGTTLNGCILGQCDCGEWEVFNPGYIASSRRCKSPAMCRHCRAIFAAMRRQEKTGDVQILVP